MRYWEFILEDELKALSAFIDKWGEQRLPLPIIIAKAKSRRNQLATARVLAKGQYHWAQLLKAAGKTNGPIPAHIKPLAAPQSPAKPVARYPSSGLNKHPVQTP